MPSSRKRRPSSFDLTPPAEPEAAPSGWTYRSDAAPAGAAAAPPPRRRRLLDAAVWPAEIVLLLLLAPFGARRDR